MIWVRLESKQHFAFLDRQVKDLKDHVDALAAQVADLTRFVAVKDEVFKEVSGLKADIKDVHVRLDRLLERSHHDR